MSLEYLFSPTKQFTYPSGKLLDGGKIFVYFKDTTDLVTLYSPNGSFVSNPILLDANGRASVRADIAYQYRLEVYTNDNVLLYTCEAFCEGDGSGGFSFVIHDETLSGNGTASSPLGVINIPLAVEDSLTAYEDIVEGKNALVLGVNNAWLNDKLDQELEGKVDRTEFEDCCSAVNAALDNKLDISAYDLSNYYNKQETNDLLDQRVDRYEFTQTMNWVDQTKQDKLEFGYDENSAISSINNSALAGQGGGDDCPWISGGKNIADTQVMTGNMLIQILSSFDVSGDHNHFIGMKGGIYRFPNEYEIGSALLHTNYFMHQSAMSAYVPFSSYSSYTASISDNLQQNWDYTTSAYNLSLNNFYNKLDISAFSAWSASFTSGDYELSAGEGISITDDIANQKTIITNNISAGTNISLVYNSATNKIRIDCNEVGRTYSGVAPIQVNNSTNQISISGEELSAGPNIDIFPSGGYVIISANGGNTFPITGTDGTANYTANANFSSFTLTTGQGVVGCYVNLDAKNVSYVTYPTTEVSASWHDIIQKANEPSSNCYCIRFTDNMTATNLSSYLDYDKVTVVNSNTFSPNCMLYWNGKTKVFPSGFYCEFVKGTDDQNQIDWVFTTSGWTNNIWWDLD